MDPLAIVFLLLIAGGIVFVIVGPKRLNRRRAEALAEAGPRTEPARTNPLAIVAFVLAFFATIPAIVCGHVAVSQLTRSSDGGWGLAIASLWISYSVTILLFIGGPIVFYYLTQGTWGL